MRHTHLQSLIYKCTPLHIHTTALLPLTVTPPPGRHGPLTHSPAVWSLWLVAHGAGDLLAVIVDTPALARTAVALQRLKVPMIGATWDVGADQLLAIELQSQILTRALITCKHREGDSHTEDTESLILSPTFS